MRSLLTFLLCLLVIISYARQSADRYTTPARFRANKGQVTDQQGNLRSDIQFQFAARGLSAFIGVNQIHYQFNRLLNPSALPATRELSKQRSKELSKQAPDEWLAKRLPNAPLEYTSYRIDMQLLGANPQAETVTENEWPGADHYFKGGGKKIINIRSYEKLVYKEVYPGIDWVLFVKEAGLKYDFIVHPNGKLSDIKIRYDGASNIRLSANGDLVITTPEGTLTEQAPYSYEATSHRTITSRFQLSGNVVSFAAANPKTGMVIDPLISWATYIGGSSIDYILAMTTDNNGNVFVTGDTHGPGNIATTGAHQVNYGGGNVDAWVAKFNKAGVRQWGTYFGAGGTETGGGIVTNEAGEVYVSASSAPLDLNADNMATAGSHQSVFGGGAWDAMLLKFDPTGMLMWASYLGGEGDEYGFALTCDKEGAVYFGGLTSSTVGIATPGSWQPAFSGFLDAYVEKFTPAGQRVWGTYLGVIDGYERVAGIACDKNSNVYATGSYFVTKFDKNGINQWKADYGEDNSAIAVDTSGNAYVTGVTYYTDGLGTPGAFQENRIGYGSAAYLAKFDTQGQRAWSTYYSWENSDFYGNSVACDRAGHVYMAARAWAWVGWADATTPNANHPNYGGGDGDAYLARFTTAGKREWASFYGGPDGENFPVVACDTNNTVYLAGATTSSTGIATPGSHQTTWAGDYDGFIVKYDDCFAIAAPRTLTGNTKVCPGAKITYSIPATSCATSYKWKLPAGWTGSSTTNTITAVAGTTGGNIEIEINGVYDTSITKQFPVTVADQPVQPVIAQNGATLTTGGVYTAYQWYLNEQLIAGAVNSTYEATKSGNYTLAATNADGCIDTSAAYRLILEHHLFVPNVFTPNGDAKNDELKVYGNLIVSLDFMVYNQWGEKVFESHDKNAAWDGRVKGKPQPVGVYAYVVKATLSTGETVTKKGTVSLVR